jgi:hypothetical protein
MVNRAANIDFNYLETLTLIRHSEKVLIMRIFLSIFILILIFSLQSWSWADDIRDFEIEGMSIGDSALDYYSEEEILNNKVNWYKKDDFYAVVIEVNNSNYQAIQMHFKKNDKSFIIQSVGGMIFNYSDIKNCHKLKKSVENEIINNFNLNRNNINRYERNHPIDPSGKSTTSEAYINLDNGNIYLACFDLAKNIGPKNFRLVANTLEINDFYE